MIFDHIPHLKVFVGYKIVRFYRAGRRLNGEVFTLPTLIDSGWDNILARFYAIIEESKRQENKITQEYLANFWKKLAPFDGVPEMFDRLRQSAYAITPKVEVEFYLISCGMVEIARNNCIAPKF